MADISSSFFEIPFWNLYAGFSSARNISHLVSHVVHFPVQVCFRDKRDSKGTWQ